MYRCMGNYYCYWHWVYEISIVLCYNINKLTHLLTRGGAVVGGEGQLLGLRRGTEDRAVHSAVAAQCSVDPRHARRRVATPASRTAAGLQRNRNHCAWWGIPARPPASGTTAARAVVGERDVGADRHAAILHRATSPRTEALSDAFEFIGAI